MATLQQYELGAQNLTQRARDSKSEVEKMKIMAYIGNLRDSQYRATGEKRAKKLARNCRTAEEKFLVKAIRSQGLDNELLKRHDWYGYRPKMNEIQAKVARGEKVCKYYQDELIKYGKMLADEEFDRQNDI